MGFDALLIVLIVGGIVLSAAYLTAEYRGWREHSVAKRRTHAALRALHAASLSEQRDALLPSVLKLQGFGEREAANPGVSDEFAAARRFLLAERRKRARQRATH